MQRQKLSAPYREKDRRCFGIKHYAGDVIYDVVDFVEKNKDEMLPNLTELVLSSRNDFIRDVLFAAAAAAAAAVSGMSTPTPSTPASGGSRSSPIPSSASSKGGGGGKARSSTQVSIHIVAFVCMRVSSVNSTDSCV